MNVVFIDIDGVLNNSNTKSMCGDHVGVDSTNIRNLKKILNTTNAVLVLTGSWINNKDDVDYLRKKLGKYGVHIMSTTDDIKNWYKKNDDVVVEKEIVLTSDIVDKEKGLTENDVKRILEGR